MALKFQARVCLRFLLGASSQALGFRFYVTSCWVYVSGPLDLRELSHEGLINKDASSGDKYA